MLVEVHFGGGPLIYHTQPELQMLSNTGHFALPALTLGPHSRLDFKCLMVGLVATNLATVL